MYVSKCVPKSTNSSFARPCEGRIGFIDNKLTVKLLFRY